MPDIDVEQLIYSGKVDPRQLYMALEQADSEDRLVNFVKHQWPILEPAVTLSEGWALDAICEHLEAVTMGHIQKLVINVPPGSTKSLTSCVLWPAWEWGPRNMPWNRYVAFSYSAHLTERDNGRFKRVITSYPYQICWGRNFNLVKTGDHLVTNDHTGFKIATSVGGVGTGERGDRVILDDPHNVKQSESKTVREETVRWFAESMSNRLNDLRKSATVVIMQRVHEDDVSGYILSKELAYEHLCIPAEYDSARKCYTSIGWEDPRTKDGELWWPQRFPVSVVTELRKTSGPYAWAGQYQQTPEVRGGGIFKRADWMPWPRGGRDEEIEMEQWGKKLEFPECSFILASADTAYTEKEENDPTGFTVWGVFRDPKTGRPGVILMYAWRERLELNPLVKRIDYDCRRLKVSRLIIENKASGISVAQELRRMFAGARYGIQLFNQTRQGDKVARAYAVQHLWSEGLVFAPDRGWSQMVQDEMAIFPKGSTVDLTDSATMALKFLRDTGILVRRDEWQEDQERAKQFPEKSPPLYPA